MNGVVAGVFSGTCAIVPFLKAPGFCKITTVDTESYPDVSAMFSGSLAMRVAASLSARAG